MNSWAAGSRYDCNFLCICVLGDRSAYGLCKEMSNEMKLTHCVNGFVPTSEDMPTYGQLGCQGFIVLDKDHNVISDATTPFMQVRGLAFEHVEALLSSLCAGLPIPEICPGEQAELIEAPETLPQLKGATGICVKIEGADIDFGFMDGPFKGRMMKVKAHTVRRLAMFEEQGGQGCSSGNCQPGTSCSQGSCKPGGGCESGSCKQPESCYGGDCENANGQSGCKLEDDFVKETLNLVSVNVPSMDAEHAECAEAFRGLAEHMSKAALERVFKCLSEHFSHEEALFEKFDFGAHANKKLSARHSHEMDHGRILDKVRTQLAAPLAAVPSIFVRELLQDFHDHTSRYDVQYANYLVEKGAQ